MIPILDENKLIIDINFFPSILNAIQSKNKRLSKDALEDIRDEILICKTRFRDSYKLFRQSRLKLNNRLRRFSNQNDVKSRNKRPIISASPNGESTIIPPEKNPWLLTNRFFVPIPSQDQYEKMFKINFPDLPSTNDNVGAHLAQIAMNSSPMALVPRHNFELHFETEDIQENKSNVLNLLLSSLVPAVLPPNDPLQQPSKSDRKIPYHYLPPLIEECDCYMQYGFTERLLFELEGAGFDEFNFEKSSNPTQYEIDEISNELENRVKPQMEELRDELMKKLDKYRAIARKRNIENENFIYLKSTIKKRKRRSGRKS